MTNENKTLEEIKEQLIKNDDKHSPNYSLISENPLQEAPIFDLNDSASFSEQQFSKMSPEDIVSGIQLAKTLNINETTECEVPSESIPTTPVTELDPTQN